MKNLILVKDYKSKLGLMETEIAIKYVKDTFERELANNLNLTRVSAPLVVEPKSGLNDHLNGYERVVRFDVLDLKADAEIVQSLAKWKRVALKKYGFKPESGLYTDMNAIRRDEELDTIHSMYVDQWDWERVLVKEERSYEYLQSIVRKIYAALKNIDEAVVKEYPVLKKKLVDDIYFISTTELENKYPTLSRKERENAICKEYGSVFIYQIGWPLADGTPHDGRAADYDDWKLNGDIVVWNDVLGMAFELSSMGIRVDEDSLVEQLKYKQEEEKMYNPYSKAILNKELPYTIGGGIGQSRLCMFFLEKAHIGEVQVSLWSEEDIKLLAENGIILL